MRQINITIFRLCMCTSKENLHSSFAGIVTILENEVFPHLFFKIFSTIFVADGFLSLTKQRIHVWVRKMDFWVYMITLLNVDEGLELDVNDQKHQKVNKTGLLSIHTRALGGGTLEDYIRPPPPAAKTHAHICYCHVNSWFVLQRWYVWRNILRNNMTGHIWEWGQDFEIWAENVIDYPLSSAFLNPKILF